ncbi:hypothetical protein ACFBZI_07370 [Moraxella sp. ZJ142]|uniref:hypothetical protein n=1 Tax=Moraxella marmotae TaxID=3344520 RepID=UPI0035D51E3C
MDVVGVIKFKIERLSNDNRQENILSLLYIVWFLILAMAFINITTNMVINAIGRPVFLLINSFIESIKNNPIPNFELNYLDFFDISITGLIAVIKSVFLIFITVIYVKYFEKMEFKTELIYMIINTIITMFLFLDIKIIISLILVIFLLMLIVPISSGRYFSVLKKIRYLIYLYEEQNVKIDKKIIQKALIKWLLIIIICSLLSYLITQFVSFFLGFFLCMTFAMRIYMGINSEDKVLDIARKIILYIIVILIYIFLNKQSTAEIDKLIGLIVTIYFAWDRLFSISKDMEDLINDKSVLFYYEEENISEKKLSKRYVNFNFINTKMDENELVIQILIRFNMIYYKSIILENDKQVRKEITRLCELYKSLNYSLYYLLIGYIGILINKDQLEKREYSLKLEELFKKNSDSYQKLIPIDAIFDYISKLCDSEKYEEVIRLYKKYLEIYVKTFDKDRLSLLMQAANTIDKPLYKRLKKLAEIQLKVKQLRCRQ